MAFGGGGGQPKSLPPIPGVICPLMAERAKHTLASRHMAIVNNEGHYRVVEVSDWQVAVRIE